MGHVIESAFDAARDPFDDDDESVVRWRGEKSGVSSHLEVGHDISTKIFRAVTGNYIPLRLDYVESGRRTLRDMTMPSGCDTAEANLLHPVAVLGTYRRG